MLFLTIWLLVETNKSVAEDRQLFSIAYNRYRCEQITQIICFTFFALSYLGRFILDEIYDGDFEIKSEFRCQMSFDILIYIEGLSMGSLFFLHYRNFKSRKTAPQQDLNSESDGTMLYANDYIYCRTEDLGSLSRETADWKHPNRQSYDLQKHNPSQVQDSSSSYVHDTTISHRMIKSHSILVQA